MLPPSRLGCPLSLKTPNMGNTGLYGVVVSYLTESFSRSLLALMITTVLCYSATSGSSVADCGKPCRVDMGNVGLEGTVSYLANLTGASARLRFSTDLGISRKTSCTEIEAVISICA